MPVPARTQARWRSHTAPRPAATGGCQRQQQCEALTACQAERGGWRPDGGRLPQLHDSDVDMMCAQVPCTVRHATQASTHKSKRGAYIHKAGAGRPALHRAAHGQHQRPLRATPAPHGGSAVVAPSVLGHVHVRCLLSLVDPRWVWRAAQQTLSTGPLFVWAARRQLMPWHVPEPNVLCDVPWYSRGARGRAKHYTSKGRAMGRRRLGLSSTGMLKCILGMLEVEWMEGGGPKPAGGVRCCMQSEARGDRAFLQLAAGQHGGSPARRRDRVPQAGAAAKRCAFGGSACGPGVGRPSAVDGLPRSAQA
jgi:hypothetical protein